MSQDNCQSEIAKIRSETKFTIALAGNPNVGKSTLFNQLTGLGAVTANYPGKTVSLNIGTAEYKGISFGVIDLPGTYSLGCVSEDQFVARQEILERKAEVVVVIVDATNLERNLYLVLQLLDIGCPVVMACNLMDLAAKKNIFIETNKLSRLLGVPVIPMTAATGEGVEELVATCFKLSNNEIKSQPILPEYSKDIMHQINKLSRVISENMKKLPYGLSARALSILILEEDEEFVKCVTSDQDGRNVLKKVKEIYSDIERVYGEKPAIKMARERHGYEGVLVDKVQRLEVCRVTLSTRLWRWSLEPLTGLPMLVAGLIAIFMIMFYVGGFLSVIFDNSWATFISPNIKFTVFSIFGPGLLSNTLLWGVDAGIQAALAVGLPYIITFFIILAFLEDSGYLNSIAFLTDSLMHKIGLHGRAVIPIIAGAGCNVPAIIGTRVLTTRKEKIIACTLITLVPCSARTAVIMGAVAFWVGWQWALAVYLIDFIVGLLVGKTLAILLPGHSSGLVMEVFPFRRPRLKTVVQKTWVRFKEFMIIALPVIVVGSLVLGGLYETKLMWLITRPMSPIIENWLGLPAVAGICLLFGLLRKEFALQLLIALAIIQYGPKAQNILSFMTKEQIFVFALVTTLYIPCLATVSVLFKELGWKAATAITLFTIVLAVLVGGLANHAMIFLHILQNRLA